MYHCDFASQSVVKFAIWNLERFITKNHQQRNQYRNSSSNTSTTLQISNTKTTSFHEMERHRFTMIQQKDYITAYYPREKSEWSTSGEHQENIKDIATNQEHCWISNRFGKWCKGTTVMI